LSDIRRFLECPLQGWARVMLRLREDDDGDESQRQDERFALGSPVETSLLRNVFLDSLQSDPGRSIPDTSESLYPARWRRLGRRGQRQVGLFVDVQAYRPSACLAGWPGSAAEGGLLTSGPFGVCRFGRADESERVERVEPPVIVDVLGQRVEVYGRTEI